jgi:hypothetical protein
VFDSSSSSSGGAASSSSSPVKTLGFLNKSLSYYEYNLTVSGFSII